MPPDFAARLARKWCSRRSHDLGYCPECDRLIGAVREALEEAEKIVQSTGWFVWGPFGQGRVADAIAALREGI